ncbi:MAG TPA: hypothetical protein PKC03_15565 [Dokdonella sp.]|nr:hypothetical protein [Dokdonella sp.]
MKRRVKKMRPLGNFRKHGDRASSIELASTRRFMGRRVHYRRFTTIVKEFNDALNLPLFNRTKIEAEADAKSCSVERVVRSDRR